MLSNVVKAFFCSIIATVVFQQSVFAQLQFTRTIIDGQLSSAYWVYGKDIDGDGDIDLVTASFTGIHWWRNNGSGGFSKNFVGSLTGSWSSFADDIDQDGDVDILGSSPTTDEVIYWRNNGSESFSPVTVDNVSQDPETVVSADLDGDGDNDVIAAAWMDGQIVAFENTGGGNFTRRIIDSNLSGAHSVKSGDMDGDGDWDIVASGAGATRWYRNNGNFNFSQSSLAGNGAWSVFIADIDGDGDNDVLRTQRNNGDVDWLQNGGGGFSEHTIEAGYGESWSVAAGDLDGDGDMDVAAAGFSANNIKVWLNNGSGGFGAGIIVDGGNRPRAVYIADLDGDGDGDIAAAIRDDKDLNWYRTEGSPPPQNTITLTSPNGGESLVVGQTAAVSWNSTGSFGNVRIELSTDGGASWTTVVASTANDGSYNWVVPGLLSNSCLIRIAAVSDGSISDTGDGVFSIVTGTLTLIFPNGGDDLFTGDIATIVWNSSGAIGDVMVELSTDGGGSWSVISAATPDDGSYTWSVPAVSSNYCLIRLTSLSDGSVTDSSDDVFSIRKGALSITFPNGGETLLFNSSQTISWQSQGNVTSVDIALSLDGGTTWISVAAGTENDGAYQWTVPAQASVNCLLRITDSSEPSIESISTSPFTITSGVLTLTAPNGGERLLNGSGYIISWETLGTIPFVRVEYSVDNGLTWNLVTEGLANMGSYVWSVPFDLSSTALVRVSDTFDGDPSDVSDAVFAIVSQLENMSITINCDDAYELYVNGQFVGSDVQWDIAQTYLVPLLDGPNVIAVKADNPHREGGLIVEVKINGDVVLVTQPNWRFSPSEEVGWVDITFDDSGWQTATDLGGYGVAPWFTNVQGIDAATTARWIWEADPLGHGGFFRAGFEVNNIIPAPAVLSFTPTQGEVGSEVMITGINFGGASRVAFNGVDADTFTVESGGLIRAVVPQAATTGRITVVTPGGIAVSDSDFVVTVARLLTLTAPNGGEVLQADSSFAITWLSEGPIDSLRLSYSVDGGLSWMEIDSTAANSGLFLWQVPATATDSALVRISDVSDSTVVDISDNVFAIEVPRQILPPVILSFTPTAGVVGTSVTITGENFVGVTDVSLGDTSLVFNVLSSQKITAGIAAGAVSGQFSVTTQDGRAVSQDTFIVYEPPVISTFSPQQGVAGEEVIIDGRHFTHVSAVRFDSLAAVFQVQSDVRILAVVPDSAVSGKISVVNPAGTTVSDSIFTVVRPPEHVFLHFLPSDDAYADPAHPSVNYGRDEILKAQSGAVAAYLKFHVFGINGQIRKAYLSLEDIEAGVGDSQVVTVSNNFRNSDRPWDEFRLTAENAPVIPLGSSPGQALKGTSSSDVTALIHADGVVSFAIFNESLEAQAFYAKENPAHRPQLVVEMIGQPDGVPRIDDCTPKNAFAGSEIRLRGSFANIEEIIFNGARTSNFTTVSDSELVVTIPKGARSGNVGVRNPVGTGVSGPILTVQPRLFLYGFEPDSARAGDTVRLLGKGLLAVDELFFDTRAAAFEIQSDTTIVAVVPDSVTSGFITVVSAYEEGVSPTQFRAISGHVLGVDDHEGHGSSIPETTRLLAGYPNPFNGEVTIPYALSEEGKVRLVIFNALGQRIRTLVDEMQPRGFMRATWDGKDSFGRSVASGIYFIKLTAGNAVFARRISLQK